MQLVELLTAILLLLLLKVSYHKNNLHDGSLDLSQKWAVLFLVRRGFVKIKATKAVSKIPPDYLDLKLAYLTS